MGDNGQSSPVIHACLKMIHVTFVQAHPFDELRFDVSINDNVWYLRCKNEEDRHKWLDALELQKAAAEAESTSLQRQGSMLSLHSTASLASSSSFKVHCTIKIFIYL